MTITIITAMGERERERERKRERERESVLDRMSDNVMCLNVKTLWRDTVACYEIQAGAQCCRHTMHYACHVACSVVTMHQVNWFDVVKR